MLDVEEHYDKIYRYCYFKLHNTQLAEDITQETFLRFLECDSYKETGRPLAFLYTVARNLCMDEFRRKKPEPLPENFAQEDGTKGQEAGVFLSLAMEKLNAAERELILLRYVNEVSYADLTKIYKESRYVLYRRIKSILKKLRNFME